MLRLPASRALQPSSSLLPSAVRSRTGTSFVSRTPGLLRPLSAVYQQQQQNQQQIRQQHAVSNPTLANIEKRWEQMPPQEQAELWMALRDRMTVDWHELTMQEKKASYWIAFGPHGPRALTDPNEKWQILRVVLLCLAGSAAVFGLARFFGGKPPKTMNSEWQEMTNEYLKAQKTEAITGKYFITGVSSPGYQGKGMVQSQPSGKKPGADAE